MMNDPHENGRGFAEGDRGEAGLVREVSCSQNSISGQVAWWGVRFFSVERAFGKGYGPTFDEASVRLLSVVLLPAEGLPTRPISGSRGIVSVWACGAVVVNFENRSRGSDFAKGAANPGRLRPANAMRGCPDNC